MAVETSPLPDTTSPEYSAVLTPALVHQFFSLREHDLQTLLHADPGYLRDNLNTYLPSLSHQAFDAVSSVLTLPDPWTVFGMFWVSRVAYQDLSTMSESDFNYFTNVPGGFMHRFSDPGIKAKLWLVESTSQPNAMLAVLKAIHARRDLLFNRETAMLVTPHPPTVAPKKQFWPKPEFPAPDIELFDPGDLDLGIIQQPSWTATTIPTTTELPLGYAVLAPLREIIRKSKDKYQALAELGKYKLAQRVMDILNLASEEALYAKLKDPAFSVKDHEVLETIEYWETHESWGDLGSQGGGEAQHEDQGSFQKVQDYPAKGKVYRVQLQL